MWTFILRRAIRAVPILFVISLLSFSMMYLAPGSPIGKALDPKVTPETIDRWKKNFELDKPLPVRYGRWLGRLFTGELKSMKDGQPVISKILDRLPATITLNIVAIIFSFCFAIPVGIFSATRRGSPADHAITVMVFIGLSVPIFWIAYLVILFVVKVLGLSVLGARTFGLVELSALEVFADYVWHLVVPGVMLGVLSIASLSRYVRGSMIEVLTEDYIRAARSKGLDPVRVHYIHAFKNAALPMVTIFALLIPGLIGGSVIVETVFAWPGIGRLGYDAVMARDYNVSMTLLFISAALVLVANTVADVLYAWVDPRITYGGRPG